jgi:hypothetical protein
MKIELNKIEYQCIEILFNTMNHLSNIDRTIYPSTEYANVKAFYKAIKCHIDIYDSTRFEDDEIGEDMEISKKKYQEYLDYEIILNSIVAVPLRENNIDGYKMYHKLVTRLLTKYDDIQKEKVLQKERSEEFLKDTEVNKYESVINAYEDTLENYRQFKDKVFEKFRDNEEFMEILEMFLED